MSGNTLFIRLEAPLQSWGFRARWTDRETALEPTKSGVIGLLACALGWGRTEDDRIRSLTRDVTFGVRVDVPGRVIRDYHTVVGGAMSADGKIKRTASTGEPETVVSPRFYLSDASFLAAVQGPADLISHLSEALNQPAWPLYLGRKSCPPSVALWDAVGSYDSLDEALRTRTRSSRSAPGRLRAAVEVAPGQGVRRNDQIDALSRRTYLPRYSKDILVDPPYPEEPS